MSQLSFNSLFHPGKELLVNFDWIDVTSNIGFIVYECAGMTTSTGTSYVMLRNTDAAKLYGTVNLTNNKQFESGFGPSGNTPLKIVDNDFDLKAAILPFTINGEAIVKISSKGHSIFTETQPDAVWYVIAKLRKWDGSTETEIASVQTETTTTNDNSIEKTATMPMVIPKTNFKKGDVLRLTIELWGWTTTDSGDNTPIQFAHCPTNITTDNFMAGNSKLTISIPYELRI